MELRVDPDLSSILTLGVLAMDDVMVVERDPKLDGPLAEAARQARTNPAGDPTAVRTMYRRVGIDPTKTRPSSEALLRRVTRGDGMPRINSLVDICNWCSLGFQLPYGLYDRARISGSVELRLGRDGEEYAGIRKEVVHLAGRLTLARRRRSVRQPDVRFVANDGDASDAQRPFRGVHAQAAGPAVARRARWHSRARRHLLRRAGSDKDNHLAIGRLVSCESLIICDWRIVICW